MVTEEEKNRILREGLEVSLQFNEFLRKVRELGLTCYVSVYEKTVPGYFENAVSFSLAKPPEGSEKRVFVQECQGKKLSLST